MNALVTQILAGGLALAFLLFAVVVGFLLFRSNKRDSMFEAALPGVNPEPVNEDPSYSPVAVDSDNDFDFRSAPQTVRRIEVRGPSSQPYVPQSHAPELAEFTPTRPASSATRTGRRAATPTSQPSASSASSPHPASAARRARVAAPAPTQPNSQPRRDNR